MYEWSLKAVSEEKSQRQFAIRDTLYPIQCQSNVCNVCNPGYSVTAGVGTRPKFAADKEMPKPSCGENPFKNSSQLIHFETP